MQTTRASHHQQHLEARSMLATQLMHSLMGLGASSVPALPGLPKKNGHVVSEPADPATSNPLPTERIKPTQAR